jgi:hypothetical protein
MLTIKGITDFCWDAVGVLLTSKDDIIVKKHGGIYWIYFKHTRGPAYLIRDMWERRIIDTKYDTDKVKLSIL